jgi:hypothetical protein
VSPQLFLSDWRRIRRHAVPARMIAACAEARSRGDWRAACAAARIDVGPDVADDAPVEHFAPDLLRWHLPRALHGSTAFAEGQFYLLIPDEPVGPDTVLLTVRSPETAEGPQRLRLGTVRGADDLHGGRAVPVPAYLWDARHAAGLRAALGGSAHRLPLLTASGEPLPEDSVGAGDDLAARAERVWRAPTRREAFAEAGFGFTPGQEGEWRSADRNWPLEALDPLRLAHETRWLAARLQERTWVLWQHSFRYLTVFVEPGDGVRVSLVSSYRSEPGTVADPPGTRIAMVRYSADLELLRQGRLKPGALHPLVRDALFPGAPADPFRPEDGELVRVRCNGVWHEIEARLGRLDPLAHTLDERQRERAMRAFGGAVEGCFAVEQLWYGGLGRLPRQLRAYRAELWEHLIHGGTGTLLELLGNGLDPHLRDSTGGTLIHRIAAFDHREVLPRLLAEGVDVDTVDKEGYTALFRIVLRHGPSEVITALVDAGADPRIRNRARETVLDYAEKVLGYGDRLRPDFREALDHLRKRAR